MKVLILAGGFATRLWPLTEKRAKPLLYVGGKPLISHMVERLPSHLEIIISTNKVFEAAFEEWKLDFPERSIRIFVEDAGSDSGKPGALAATALAIKEYNICESLLLLAGDNYVGFDVETFIAFFNDSPLLAVYDTKSLMEAKKFGVVNVEGSRVTAFAEKPEHPDSTLVSTGCYIFPQKYLAHIGDYALTNADNLGGIFEYLLQKGEPIEAYRFSEEWIDIGSFTTYMSAHRSLQKRTTLHPSSSVKNSTLGACVYIGEDCVIEDSELENVLVMKGTRLKGVRARNTIIDTDCVIDGLDIDYKMIRSGFTYSY